CLIHEVDIHNNGRCYHHRFVWFDETNKLQRLSRPFFFEHHGIEYAAGLCWHPDGKHLIISYGVDDRDPRIAMVNAADVRGVLLDADRPPFGIPPTDESGQHARLESENVALLAVDTKNCNAEMAAGQNYERVP